MVERSEGPSFLVLAQVPDERPQPPFHIARQNLLQVLEREAPGLVVVGPERSIGRPDRVGIENEAEQAEHVLETQLPTKAQPPFDERIRLHVVQQPGQLPYRASPSELVPDPLPHGCVRWHRAPGQTGRAAARQGDGGPVPDLEPSGCEGEQESIFRGLARNPREHRGNSSPDDEVGSFVRHEPGESRDRRVPDLDQCLGGRIHEPVPGEEARESRDQVRIPPSSQSEEVRDPPDITGAEEGIRFDLLYRRTGVGDSGRSSFQVDAARIEDARDVDSAEGGGQRVAPTTRLSQHRIPSAARGKP